jgi:hypothetical protein
VEGELQRCLFLLSLPLSRPDDISSQVATSTASSSLPPLPPTASIALSTKSSSTSAVPSPSSAERTASFVPATKPDTNTSASSTPSHVRPSWVSTMPPVLPERPLLPLRLSSSLHPATKRRGGRRTGASWSFASCSRKFRSSRSGAKGRRGRSRRSCRRIEL